MQIKITRAFCERDSIHDGAGTYWAVGDVYTIDTDISAEQAAFLVITGKAKYVNQLVVLA